MTDELERRGRSAGAAVHARASRLDPGDGLDTVLRRGRRPRPSAVVATVLAVVLAVPGAAWLLDQGQGGDVRFGEDPPATEPVTEDPTATPQPTATVEPGPGATEPGPGATATEPGATPTPDATPTPEDTASAGPQPLGEFGTGEVLTPGYPLESSGHVLLTDVRLAGQAGFDRIVLEFEGEGTPAYRVAYEEPPIIQDGSGEEVEIAGEAFLVVHLTPASGVDMSAGGDSGYALTYEGPNRLSGDTGVVTEFVRTGDFEANLTWVAGLASRQPFAVTVLQDPLRLVVDIQAP